MKQYYQRREAADCSVRINQLEGSGTRGCGSSPCISLHLPFVSPLRRTQHFLLSRWSNPTPPTLSRPDSTKIPTNLVSQRFREFPTTKGRTLWHPTPTPVEGQFWTSLFDKSPHPPPSSTASSLRNTSHTIISHVCRRRHQTSHRRSYDLDRTPGFRKGNSVRSSAQPVQVVVYLLRRHS
jgi:hypothetical protein